MKYEILENAEIKEFSLMESFFYEFITRFISKNRKDRWLYLIKHQNQFSKKFKDLWGHLETEKSSSLQLEKLNNESWFYYDGSDEPIYVLHTNELCEVCLNEDGIAFSSTNNTAIFFTHEGTEYVFKWQ